MTSSCSNGFGSNRDDKSPNRDKPVHCYIEVTSDGFITVYGPDNLHCKILIRPHVNTAEKAIKVEELIDLRLPPKYKAVRWANMIRKTGMVRKITLEDLYIAIANCEFLDYLKGLEPDQLRHVLSILEA